MSKFQDVPVEDDTKIKLNLETTFGDYDVLYQKWYWDGIYADSLIFIANDVEGLDDDALKAYVSESELVTDKDAGMTIKRDSKGYTFVNFNFVYE